MLRGTPPVQKGNTIEISISGMNHQGEGVGKYGAVKDARHNAEINGIENVEFVEGDVADTIEDLAIKLKLL